MRRVRKRLLAVPAVAAALFLAAPAPACALPLTVTTTGPVSFDGGLHLLNLYTGTAFSCVSSHLDAVAQSLPPLFQFNGASISGCTGLFNLQVDVTPKFFPWEMSAYSIGNGEATGSITGVYFTVDTSDGCQAEISGSAGGSGTMDARYSNTGELALSGGSGTDLAVTFANALCDPALITVGDRFAVTGALFATPIVTVTP